MARSVGADQDVMRLEASHLYDNLVETLWHTERTIDNTLGVAKLLMSRHVNQAGYKVVVTGEGSDELFAGYPALRRDMFLHGLETLSPAERASWEQLLAESNQLFKGAMLAEDEVRDPALEARVGFTPSCLQPWLAAGARAPALMHPDLRGEVAGYAPGEAIAQALDAEMLAGRDPLDNAQYVWIKTMLEGQILTWGEDRVDMANSMEARPPFLDHHLAEFAAQVQLDAVINHLIGVQVLHRHFVATDIPALAQERAAALGWRREGRLRRGRGRARRGCAPRPWPRRARGRHDAPGRRSRRARPSRPRRGSP